MPLYGGILVDMRRLNHIEFLSDDTIEVEGGAVWEAVETVARQHGRELRVMPTTYHIATVAGFLAGGSGGLGSVTYGRTWDNNFSSVDMLTAQEPPRTIRLDGDDLRMVMHTYGTVGIVALQRGRDHPQHRDEGERAADHGHAVDHGEQPPAPSHVDAD